MELLVLGVKMQENAFTQPAHGGDLTGLLTGQRSKVYVGTKYVIPMCFKLV